MVSDSLLVAQLTDTHLFADEAGAMMGVQTAQTFRAVIERVKGLPRKPDILLLTGDLSQDETPASYERLRDAVNALQIPTYWIPGNHDVLDVMQPVLKGGMFLSERGFQAGGWNVVLLDSVVPRQTAGELSAAELAFLDRQLRAFSHLPGLVALHHPPCLIDSTWMDEIGLQNADALYEVLEQHPQVKIVLFGHIHQAFDSDRQGIRYLGTPSACIQFKPRSATFAVDETLPGLRLLELFPDHHFKTQIERVSPTSTPLQPIAQ